jgi:hypothetical protein
MADTRKSGGTSKKKKNGTKAGSHKTLVTAAKAGAAIGIGSAALVAALLYANRPKDEAAPQPLTDPRFEPSDS